MPTVSLYNLPSHHLHHKFFLSLPSHCFSQQTPSCSSFFRQEIWQCFSLQLTSTSPPQVCLEFTTALLFTSSASTLRLIFVMRFGSVSLYNLPSQHLHHKFVLSLPSHRLSQQTPSRCALFCQEIW